MATIVYIEDEEDIRQDVSEELHEAGYDVIEACNGAEGLAAIRSSRPDMVVCDVSMPVMTGLELLAELREGDARYNDLPFIFLTALADRGDIINGKKAGADDYLTKPIDLEMLLATVDTRLRQVKRAENKKNNQMVKLYKARAGEDAMPSVEAEQDETLNGGLAITVIADDLFKTDKVILMFEAQGHEVVRMNSGRKFLDELEAGTFPDLALMALNTVDLAAPLLIKLMRDTYQISFPVLLLIPPDMDCKVGDDQLQLFDGHIAFPCTAQEFAAEVLKLLPQND